MLSQNPREDERQRLTIRDPGLSVWQRYCPVDAWRDPLLGDIEKYLDQPATHDLFDECERTENYPDAVLDHLRGLGLQDILSPRGKDSRFTTYHMCALLALAARRDTSVAVTLSVNFLGLLPAYLAASEEQIEAIGKRVESGSFSSLLLSELSHGSNILRNQTKAERGTLDGNGNFIEVGEEEPCTHYRLEGEKHLINGTTRHGLMFACLRTRNFDAYDLDSEVVDPMSARGDFTLFWLERAPGMHALPRFHTLPARAADISGLRFDNCIIEADRVIGREHGGLATIHKTLMISRGGVSSLASGCLNRARDLAVTYAQRRNIYGKPIVELGAISDHLMRLEALNLLVSAISLKTTALLNAIGLAASHYTSVAKTMACALAEEGVREGQKVLGARSLLRELPYERVIRDVNLYGIFDGTSHMMLEELGARLAREARPLGARAGSTTDEIASYYATAPRSATETLRTFRRPIIFPLVQHLRSLDALGGELSLEPLAVCAESLFALVRRRRELDCWKSDQGARFAAAELFATLEVLVAAVELCDLDRRSALGLPEPAQVAATRDRAFYSFAITWLGGRAISSARQLAIATGGLDAELSRLAGAEQQLLEGQDEIRRQCRDALCHAALVE
jgi:alkylation response protein AidB-like acyl-CoA dehydrogenase